MLKLPTILYETVYKLVPCCAITRVQLVHHKLATDSHRTETKVQEEDTEMKRLQTLLQALKVHDL